MHNGCRVAQDESATSGQVVAFLVAGTIFLAAVASVLVMSQGAARDPVGDREAAKGVQAAGLADVLVGSAGIGWDAGPDGLERLGLLASNGSGLDAASLEALRGARADATDNDKVDYEEAMESLGMATDGSEGFHIRIYPVGLDDVAIPDDLDTAYVGDWTSLASVTLPLPILTQETMASQTNVELNLTMTAQTFQERALLRSLGVDFTDRIYITTATPSILVDFPWPIADKKLLTVLNIPLFEGDVYPDDAAYLEAVLPDRLEEYEVLIVGSGVDHEALDDNDIRRGVADWVNAGGTLIVLGSADMDDHWLKDLLDTGVSTVNGAPTAPDAAHPMLKQPNELAWTSYDSFGQGWDIKSTGADADYADFSHVVIQEGEDVLALSNQGVFASGDPTGIGGRVFLTTYRPNAIASSSGEDEAAAFLENMLLYSDRSDLYLDYGGVVPTDLPVALAVRQSWLWDDTLGQVPIRVEVLAWG